MTTYDSKTVDILLSKDTSEATKKALLEALCRHAKGVRECPECGTEAVHEDNGCEGLDKSWCCNECGCHFDEADFPEDEDDVFLTLVEARKEGLVKQSWRDDKFHFEPKETP